jgi:hypothetical protein
MKWLEKIVEDKNLLEDLQWVDDAEEMAQEAFTRLILKLFHKSILSQRNKVVMSLASHIIDNYNMITILKALKIINAERIFIEDDFIKIKVILLKGVAIKGDIKQKLDVITDLDLKEEDKKVILALILDSNSKIAGSLLDSSEISKGMFEVIVTILKDVPPGKTAELL